MSGRARAPAERPRRWPGSDLIWLVLAFVLASFGSGAAADLLTDDPLTEVLLLLLGSAVAIGLPTGLLLMGRPDRRDAIGLRRTPWREVGRGVLWVGALLPLIAVASLLMQAVLGYEDNPQSAALMLDRMSPLQLGFAALFTVLIVPFFEEVLFRGVLLSALQERGPADPEVRDRRALIASSVIFGLIHIEPAVIIPTTMLGFAAGLLRLRSGSLWPAVALHAANNAVATAVMAAGLA